MLVAVYLGSRLSFIVGLPYFLDEGIFAGYSYQGAQSAHQLFVSLTIGKEPLQAWFGIVWQALGANPLIAIRLVSVVAGLLTVGTVALLGDKLAGPTVSRVAGALCVGLPFFVVNDGVGIEEPLVTLVMSGALLVQIELAKCPRLRWGCVLGLVWMAGIMTKQSCEAAVLLLPASLLCFDWTSAGRRRRLTRWLGAVAVAALGVIAAEAALRSSDYWATGQAFSRTFPLVRPLGQVLTHPFATTAVAWSVFRPALTGYLTLPAVALGILGTVLAARRRRALTWLLLIWALAPLAAALTFTLHPYPRHLMYALPPVVVFMAEGIVGGISWLRGRLRPPLGLAAGVAGLAILLAPALAFDARALAHPRTAHYPGLDDLQYVTGVPAGGEWPAVASMIRHRAAGRRVVVFVAEADPNVIRFLLSADPRAAANRYAVVIPGQPLAAQAQFAIVDQLPFSDSAALHFLGTHHFAIVEKFQRPRGGAIISLYERG